MPSSEEIKDLFYATYSNDLLELLNQVKEHQGILKQTDMGELSFDFNEFILYNIDVDKFTKKK
jgi:hypothetical protein